MIEVGMIGFGKMAQAIAAGWQNAGLLDRIHVQAYAPHYDKLCRNCKTYDVTPMKTLHELCEASHVIILACKPAQVEGVLSECRDWVDGKLVICLAAGINHEKLDAAAVCGARIGNAEHRHDGSGRLPDRGRTEHDERTRYKGS